MARGIYCLYVQAGNCGCPRFSARLLRQGNRVALRKLLGVKSRVDKIATQLYPLLSFYTFIYSILHVVQLVIGNVDS